MLLSDVPGRPPCLPGTSLRPGDLREPDGLDARTRMVHARNASASSASAAVQARMNVPS